MMLLLLKRILTEMSMVKKFKLYFLLLVVVAYVGLLGVILSTNGPKLMPTERQEMILSIGFIASCVIVTIIVVFWLHQDKEK